MNPAFVIRHLLFVIALLLLVTSGAMGQTRPIPPYRIIQVPVAVPAWGRYRTTDETGNVTVWEHRPKLNRTDGGWGQFWYAEQGRAWLIVGGLAPRHWKSSLRRVRP